MIDLYSAVKFICMESGWTASNLKVQKILYMSHMVFMGRTEQRLVDTFFEAWDYGPVEPNLYHRVKAFGSKPIPDIFGNVPAPSGSELDVLAEACNYLLGKMPGELVSITHYERGAWAKSYIPNMIGVKIPDKDILSEYKERFSN